MKKAREADWAMREKAKQLEDNLVAAIHRITAKEIKRLSVSAKRKKKAPAKRKKRSR